ncbi:efflux RND transporter permease subunit, partial [Enterobacter hormaechei]|nr:efflux RND transporter permease subunit [Enterobacter hormaechei]
DVVKSVFTVNGFSFSGQGQNTGLAFISLKDWDQRKDPKDKVPAIVGRANASFAQIKEGLVFAFNIPPIVELGSASGFDFQLIDKGNLGHAALTE